MFRSPGARYQALQRAPGCAVHRRRQPAPRSVADESAPGGPGHEAEQQRSVRLTAGSRRATEVSTIIGEALLVVEDGVEVLDQVLLAQSVTHLPPLARTSRRRRPVRALRCSCVRRAWTASVIAAVRDTCSSAASSRISRSVSSFLMFRLTVEVYRADGRRQPFTFGGSRYGPHHASRCTVPPRIHTPAAAGRSVTATVSTTPRRIMSRSTSCWRRSP